ncbi:MAG: 3-methyl-2-oxobutanoate hydroxymethyltransferase [Spirochaetales bacterium]|nr:3-methyl-2-oxobutanoate hydroxymethyltransferase [Spirochaetales bacterium]
MTILDFAKYKQDRRKITLVTCYDATTASLLDETSVDAVLVGDSVAMTIYGFNNTLKADIPLMAAHTAAVRRGNKNIFLIGDLPFLSYRKGPKETLAAAGELLKAGASAVKLEGGDSVVLEAVKAMVPAGIPVMGHLGLTPQSVNGMGGYRVQGKEALAAEQILTEALSLEEAGCFALVLECVPRSLAKKITEKLTIPVIGIGAGKEVDGQVLVIQDLLGETRGPLPKFVRSFSNGAAQIVKGVENYCREVREGSFPSIKESYK